MRFCGPVYVHQTRSFRCNPDQICLCPCSPPSPTNRLRRSYRKMVPKDFRTLHHSVNFTNSMIPLWNALKQCAVLVENCKCWSQFYTFRHQEAKEVYVAQESQHTLSLLQSRQKPTFADSIALPSGARSGKRAVGAGQSAIGAAKLNVVTCDRKERGSREAASR